MSNNNEYDVAIVGGGIIGLSTACSIKSKRPDAKVVVLEKNLALGKEQSSHSSGCLHAGLQYQKGSHMARLCITGNQMMRDFLMKRSIPHVPTGKLTIARNEKQMNVLKDLYENAKANGVPDLEMVYEQKRILELEPGCINAVGGLYSPTSYTLNYSDVVDQLKNDFLALPNTSIIEGFDTKAMIVDKKSLILPNNLNILKKMRLKSLITSELKGQKDKIMVVGREPGQKGPLDHVSANVVFTALGINMDIFSPRKKWWSKLHLPSDKSLQNENRIWKNYLKEQHYSGLPCQYQFWNSVITPLVGYYLQVKPSALKKLRTEKKVDLSKHIYPTLEPGDFLSVGTHLTPTVPEQPAKYKSIPRRALNNPGSEPGVIIGPLAGPATDLMMHRGESIFTEQTYGVVKYINLLGGALMHCIRDGGFRQMAIRHPIICFKKLLITENTLISQAQALCPHLEGHMLQPSYRGIMAQTFDPESGETLSDFILGMDPRGIRTKTSLIHLLNAPSPGATAALALGEDIAEIIKLSMNKIR